MATHLSSSWLKKKNFIVHDSTGRWNYMIIASIKVFFFIVDLSYQTVKLLLLIIIHKKDVTYLSEIYIILMISTNMIWLKK